MRRRQRVAGERQGLRFEGESFVNTTPPRYEVVSDVNFFFGEEQQAIPEDEQLFVVSNVDWTLAKTASFCRVAQATPWQLQVTPLPPPAKFIFLLGRR
jgi:hypothetical protein